MTGDEHEASRRAAEQIQAGHPRWLVLYGTYTREFVAFPLFAAPPGTILTAHYPPALTERMHAAERLAGCPPRR